MQPSILVVDDEETARALLRIILARGGYRVLEAANGPDALALIDNQPPDLVILDVLMPLMDGFAVCRQLRDTPRTSQLPVILLSAIGDPQSVARGLASGATRYMTKPISAGTLLAAVEEDLNAS